eukprot:TRINITY_DN9076_c0_g1_i2.p1 TRINITY_DN9076_c0_g1~~TRINITY_DN9076_c0_g1_i2.p1  ORF type:complete len:254 (+),score=101.03 TRINITY_DN9076_c0_g1_i2:87-848(+)
MDVLCVPCLSDNYGWLVHCRATGCTASVDTPDAGPLAAALDTKGWRLTHILNTHHHHDHVGGNEALVRKYGCRVVGFGKDAARIPGITDFVHEGDEVAVGNLKAAVIETPGHTTGHIVYHFPADKALFSGDTLFSMGCGRLFEGTPAMMHASLAKLKALPQETQVYCAHEYTAANARFAATVDPGNPALAARIEEVQALRAAGEATIPTTIGGELQTNPFLRWDDTGVQAAVGLEGGDAVSVFAKVRALKDSF